MDQFSGSAGGREWGGAELALQTDDVHDDAALGWLPVGEPVDGLGLEVTLRPVGGVPVKWR